MDASRSVTGLPPWLRATVHLAQQIGCSFELAYAESEDLWYASMSGPAQGESWEVKRWGTAPLACDALCRQIGATVATNGQSYRDLYAEALAGIDRGETEGGCNG